MAAATKITRAELLRLNGLISKDSGLRNAVPPSTRSAWLHLKRRPTRAKVRRLLLQAGVRPAKLAAAPSKAARAPIPDRLQRAWHLCVVLSQATRVVWDVRGSSADNCVWAVHSHGCHVTVGDALSLTWQGKQVLHADAPSVIERYVVELMKSGTKVKQRKALLNIKDLHDRHQKLHKGR